MLPTCKFTFLFIFAFILFSLTLFIKSYGECNAKNVSSDKLLSDEELITQSLIDAAMPDLKQSQLGKILTRYYNKCLGGADHWKTINSFKVTGELKTANNTSAYELVFKKPNSYKIAISSEEMTNIVAFDGNNKWEKKLSGEEWTILEDIPQMNRMIHEPELFTYLLYPLQRGKSFQFKGTLRKFNSVCFNISVATKECFLINYFIDVESYCIVAVEIIDTLNQSSSITVKYSDHQISEGIYFARKILLYVDGEWDYTVDIKEITANVGALDWMFKVNGNSF